MIGSLHPTLASRALHVELRRIAQDEQVRTNKKLAALNGKSTPESLQALLAQHNHRLVNKILSPHLHSYFFFDGERIVFQRQWRDRKFVKSEFFA